MPDDEVIAQDSRKIIARLPSSAVEYYRDGAAPASPKYAPDEINTLLPANARESYDMHEVIARMIDNSLFYEFQREQGEEVIAVLSRVWALCWFSRNSLGLFRPR